MVFLSAEVTATTFESRNSDWVADAFELETPAARPGAPISIDDLLRLRDLSSISVSPDGKWLAFSIRVASLASNDYRVRWFIVDSMGASPPSPVSVDGGQPITAYSGGLPHGYIPPEAAKWSPDGTRIAFRRRIGNRIELWTAVRTSGEATRIFAGVPQVTRFAWGATGALMFRTGLNPDAFDRLVSSEARHGWLLDGRMTHWAARTPSPLPPDCNSAQSHLACEVRTFIAKGGSAVRSATPAESADLDSILGSTTHLPSRPSGAVGIVTTRSATGFVAWTETEDLKTIKSQSPLRRIRSSLAARPACDFDACVGQFIEAIGLARAGKTVWFVKRVSDLGDEQSGPLDQMAVYEWNPEIPRVTTVLRGDYLLEECQAHDTTLFCKRSSATKPAHVVAIDLNTLAAKTVIEPNPAFATKTFPRIRKIPLVDADGNRGFAHLVYPNEYRAGRRYPLVVVQYSSRGFLRGATGNEYPILPLASEGFFILSVDMPVDLRARRELDSRELMRMDRADRRRQGNVLAAIERALDELMDEGAVDPHRMAITGLSYGAEVVHYALQKSGRFAAAIASQGAKDVSYLAQFPPGRLRETWMAGMNAETLLPGPGSVILEAAWSQQPQRLRTPLLLNLGQHEALFGFEGFAVLQHAKKPLEVRVFPGEGHIKYHPQSFAGVYENNIMWLKFWLMDAEEQDPRFREQYQRWAGMRQLMQSTPR